MSVDGNEEAEPQVPWHERTWKVIVRGEVVEVPVTITVREIRERLPQELLEEFTETIENTAGHLLRHRLTGWGLPIDRLLEHRREVAERCYWAVTDSTDYPADMDVNEIYRTGGGCLTNEVDE